MRYIKLNFLCEALLLEHELLALALEAPVLVVKVGILALERLAFLVHVTDLAL